MDLRDFRLEELRKGVGLVSQQVLLFNASVADNIAYGHAGSTPAQVEAAARAARAYGFVAALPNGYETTIADLGVRLSGGQKHRTRARC